MNIVKENYLYFLKQQYKNIYIFGAGYYAKEIIWFFGEKLISEYIEAFIVSNIKENQDLNIEGISLQNIDDISSKILEESAVILGVIPENRREVVNLLKNKKVNNIIHLETEIDFFTRNISKIREKGNKDIIEYYKLFLKEKYLFNYIEIETVNRCNGKCDFCPVNINQEQRPYHKMTEKLFLSIIKQLEEIHYTGEVGLFSNNEPFIDERIIRFAKYAKNQLPNAFIYLFTNGTLLTEQKYEEIISFLDFMQIDVYIEDTDIKIPDNVQQIIKIAEEKGWLYKTLVVKTDKNMIRYSRGGNSPNSKVKYTIKDKCALPLIQMVIRPDGKVSLCCNDARGEITLGDVNNEKLVQIWQNEQYQKIRQQIMLGRENNILCRYCNSIDYREFKGRKPKS